MREPCSREPAASLRERFLRGGVIALDGALGTELERRGIRADLPLWSTWALLEAPKVVESVHRDYVRAGAEVITAGTFRTQRRTLARTGLPDPDRQAAVLSERAVSLARRAAREAGGPVQVAGSLPPLEDCYRPDLVPPEPEARREHREQARNLARAGVDVIAVETHNTIREAVVAARAAAETGLPFWVSFACEGEPRLLSGEPLARAIEAVRGEGPLAVGVNCLSPAAASACLPVLARSGLPFCVYANLGTEFRSPLETPAEYLVHARGWLEAGARMLGGCCGTGPEHVRALVLGLTR
jgi:S-methylmethionine-dependent homocysteine/selenocysteine methylase